MKTNHIRGELSAQAKTDREAEDLERFARALATADLPHLPKESKRAIAEEIGFARPPLWRRPLTLSLSGSFVVVLILTIIAQSAQPGSVLYALKRGSERARVLVDPDFERTIIERRKDEVKRLKDADASKEQVEQAKNALDQAKDSHDDKGDDDGVKPDKSGHGSDSSGSSSDSGSSDDKSDSTPDDKSGSSSGHGSSGSDGGSDDSHDDD